ncbi:DUF488 family protein [Peribacillus sp. B-H-3]|uniref:DUF488 family protein, N3 subclade n=1 Tax=Peribacillus sp. B-H-3 TaxID=3400420 RepID=UPI003B01B4AD
MSKFKEAKGKLYTSNPSGLSKLGIKAEIWQITRAGHRLPNTLLVKHLSPSKELFQTFVKEWKGKPYDQWWDKYEKRFLEELKTEEKLKGLREVYKRLLIGENVVLVCFCNDHRFCHRKLVGEFFKPFGVVAEELNPITTEQLSIFKEGSYE